MKKKAIKSFEKLIIKGNIYEVVEEIGSFYRVKNENNTMLKYHKILFEDYIEEEVEEIEEEIEIPEQREEIEKDIEL